MIRKFAIAAMLMASMAASAQEGQQGPGGQAVDWEKVNPALFAAMKADDAAPKPDAVIRYGAEALQSGELRIPAGPGPHPVAIVIHGGCWVSRLGGTGMQAFAESLRQRGIATWDIDYRRVGNPGGGWPGTFEDLKAGVDYLPELAASHKLDLSRVILVGHSAGAHLALWSASRAKLGAPWAPAADQPKPLTVVAIDGPPVLAPLIGADAELCDEPVIVPLMGGTPADHPDRYRLATPAAHLPLGMKQMLVVGTLPQIIEPYAEGAKAAGDEVVVMRPANATHFDIVTPGTPNGDAVADWIAANAFGKAIERPRQP